MESTSINWKAFELKNDQKEQRAFECMSYMLFCAEHNNRIGLFRYKNQTGIETEPITLEGKICGFQSKYYSDSIATNKTDIIDSIKKAKSKNENIDELYFYINQEFSESSKKTQKKPKYQQEIEDEAEKLGLKIVWRVPSHLEIQLLLPENKYIYDIFFNLQPNESNLIDDIKEHNETILNSIQSEIEYENKRIKIERKLIIDDIKNNIINYKHVVISGEGGCGKTAIFKDFYIENKNVFPICIFKATELNVKNINEIFTINNNYSLYQFIHSYNEEPIKIFAIDSAEKLAEINDMDVIIKLVGELSKNGWSIVFTTRYVFLNDLCFYIKEVFKIPYYKCNISLLEIEDLFELSKKYNFKLPNDTKFIERLKNLFYLKEYLKHYSDINKSGEETEFRDVIWRKHIMGSLIKDNLNIQRERAILGIAKERSNSAKFYVNIDNLSERALYSLKQDEIIGYDDKYGGYFITHDIYEEWALNKIISRSFNNRKNVKDFFESIGSSLSIRRAFRLWLSEQLYENCKIIEEFIDVLFSNNGVDDYWKEEILVSILLSDYSLEFFKQFEKEIIENEYVLLKKIVFILRIACVDLASNVNYDVIIPKGKGWEGAISLINKYKVDFFECNINQTLPILTAWCNLNHNGNTTREAGLLVLSILQKTETEEYLIIDDSFEEKLLGVINNSSSEIKEELKDIFDRVVLNNWTNHTDPYYGLCIKILNKPYLAVDLIRLLPLHIIKLCNLFWIKNEKVDEFEYYRKDIEYMYGLRDSYTFKYFPASANQTPIKWLLQSEFKDTLEFIIAFTNSSIVKYSNSTLGKNDLTEITLHLDNLEVNQYISNAIWGMHRGVIGPVVPYLLQSIHMALEEYLLEMAEKLDSAIVKHILLIILKGAKSASLTSIVCSVVLAYPDIYVEIAILLSRTIDIFHFENTRMSYEFTSHSHYSISRGLNDVSDSLYVEERLKTCEQNFRNTTLESIFINYQYFGIRSYTDIENEELVKMIFNIIDEHKKSKSLSELDRALLSRIDRRNLKTNILEEKDGYMMLEFQPISIDEDIQQKREEVKHNFEEMQRFSGLKIWADFLYDSNKNEKYDNNPLLALFEAKELVSNDNQSYFDVDDSMHVFVCAKLLLEHLNQLPANEKDYCRQTVIKTISSLFNKTDISSISRGVEAAFRALPILIKEYRNDREFYIMYMLQALFDDTHTSGYKSICDYTIDSIVKNKIWENDYKTAEDILLRYVKLKPIYNRVVLECKNNDGYLYSKNIIRSNFLKEVDSVDYKNIDYNKINLDALNVSDLIIVLQLIPFDTIFEEHLKIYTFIIDKIKGELFENNNKFRYKSETLRTIVYKQLTKFILCRSITNVDRFIKPIIDSFCINRETATFIEELICSEDILQKKEVFWYIWDEMYQVIIELSQKTHSFYLNDILINYLFAFNYWRKDIVEWHSLCKENLYFYEKVSKDMGNIPVVLYSIVRVLNTIGKRFVHEGIDWINNIISQNNNLSLGDYENNTIYYLENLLRKYILKNKEKIKTDFRLKQKIINILGFMINKGSILGYQLRENIV